MKDFLDKLASDSPTPGGGSASAASSYWSSSFIHGIFNFKKKNNKDFRKGKKGNIKYYKKGRRR